MTETLYCSFCGKSQHQVHKLVAGPKVFICNECIDLCSDIVHNEMGPHNKRIFIRDYVMKRAAAKPGDMDGINTAREAELVWDHHLAVKKPETNLDVKVI